jgi:hypothetical protein
MELFHTRKVFVEPVIKFIYMKLKIRQQENVCADEGCQRIARLDKAERFWSKSSQNVIAHCSLNFCCNWLSEEV